MNNLSIPSKKEILNFLNKFNEFIGKNLSSLKFQNFKLLSKNIIFDRRFVITFLIVVLSIFAHLSTPAFYQDKWVLGKIKKQLEKEFNITFILPEKVSYSMFPIPSFNLEDVRFENNGRLFGKIKLMKLNLSYNKFFDKDKVNIQDVHINNSKFEIYKEDLKDFFIFFDKQINKKKFFINNSKVFLKNEDEEVYLILSLQKSVSYFNEEKLENILTLSGNVFNNPIQGSVSNNYLTKKTNIKYEFSKIGKKINIDLNYLNDPKKILFNLIDGSNSYTSNIKFDKDNLIFNSNEKIDDRFLYEGKINFKPFFSNININLKNFDLSKLINTDNLLLQIVKSKIVSNQNLNYKLQINSRNIKNHRLLKNLILCVIFDQKNFNLNGSKMNFNDSVDITVIDSEYINNQKENYFYGKLMFKINDTDKLYSFFQTRKEFRKQIDKIVLQFKYEFNTSRISIEKIEIDDLIYDSLNDQLKIYQDKEIKRLRRIEIKNLFNDIVSTL